MKPEVIIDGVWLSTVMPWGDLEWSTCWPGGTESITFGVARSHHLLRTDALVELDCGGSRIALGSLVEPTRGEPLVAEGLHRKAEDFAALTGAGAPSVDADDAINQARVRGLPWGFQTAAIPAADPPLEDDQVWSLAKLLDHKATTIGQQWGVSPNGIPFLSGWESASLHTLPGVDGLAISREGYASALFARYFDSGTATYTTTGATDTAAAARWGYVERTLSDLIAYGAPMTGAEAAAYMQGLMDQGRSQMGWGAPLEVQYGDVVTEYGQPIDLTTIHARQTFRIHGLVEDVAALSGQTWVDMPIARTRHKDGLVTIEPRGLSSPMNEALAGAAS